DGQGDPCTTPSHHADSDGGADRDSPPIKPTPSDVGVVPTKEKQDQTCSKCSDDRNPFRNARSRGAQPMDVAQHGEREEAEPDGYRKLRDPLWSRKETPIPGVVHVFEKSESRHLPD